MKHLILLLTINYCAATVAAAQETKQSALRTPHSAIEERFGDMPVQIDSALTRRFPNTTVYRDSLGNIFFKLRVMPQGLPLWGDVIAFEDGSPYANKGAIVFSELTQQELEYIIAEIRYFEKRKKVKQ